MTNTHVLVTGSNQGIGKGILERYLARPNHTVIAAIPDPSHPSSVALQELPKGEGSQLLVVKVDPLIYEDAAAAATRLQTDHSIDHLDIVVANATLPNVRPAIEDVEVPELQAHLDVNLYGLVAMYHAVRDLLKQSSREPIWVTVGSSVAREHENPHAPSKSLAHWITLKADGEEPWLNAFGIHPGYVRRETGLNGSSNHELHNGHNGTDNDLDNDLDLDLNIDLDIDLVTVDVSCDGIMKVLDDSSKEDTGGKFLDWEGEVGEW